MKQNIDLLHEADLEIAKTIVGICKRHNLKCYMLGGSMLGAIRHKGFIPWDDDIDFGLPRKDYEKLLELLPMELPSNLTFENYKTNPDYHYYITRIQDLNTKVVEINFESENKFTHVSIDLFPLDGSPNNPFLRMLFFLRIIMHRSMMSLCYRKGIDKHRKRGFFEKMFITIMTMFPTEKIFNPYNQKEKIDKILKKYPMENSYISGNIMGAYRTKEMVPTEWYGETTEYDFESEKFLGIKEYDKYLTHLYGDYMAIPPKEQQKIHYRIIEIHGQKLV